MRATLRLSSPAWLAHPISTSPMAAASNCSFRLSNSSRTKAAKSSVRTRASVPPKFQWESLLRRLCMHPYYSRWCGQRPYADKALCKTMVFCRMKIAIVSVFHPYRGGMRNSTKRWPRPSWKRGTNASASILAGNTPACFPEPINTRRTQVPIRAHSRGRFRQPHVVVPLCPARSEGTT